MFLRPMLGSATAAAAVAPAAAAAPARYLDSVNTTESLASQEEDIC